MDYGYVRVSSKDQSEDRQLWALRQAGLTGLTIYLDKQSGKDFDRPSWQKLLKRLSPGDVLYVKSIDRMGRNYAEILEQWQLLTKKKGVDVVVLDMPLLDTRRDKNLMGTFIADLVLQVLSFVAETERNDIKQRQAEGIAAAKKRGVKFGRPNHPMPPEFEGIACAYMAGMVTRSEGARLCGMPYSSFRYRVESYMAKQIGRKNNGK